MPRQTTPQNEPEPGEEAEAAKPFWSGIVTFGLVSVPVALFPATRGTRLRLRMVDREGTFLQRRFFGAEDSEALEPTDLVRGYELAKDQFVTVEDKELEALDPKKSREIDLAQFVALESLSPLHFEQSYYLVPDGGTTKAYRLLAATLEKEQRAGIATFVMRGREYLCAIVGEAGILRAETLRFADEVRSPEVIGLPAPTDPTAAEVAKFAKAIESLKARTFDLEALADRRSERIVELAQGKQSAGTDVVPAPADDPQAESDAEQPSNVVDLMEVLKARLRGKLLARTEPKPAIKPRKPAGTGGELEAKSRDDLYAMAKSAGIPGRSAMSREKLIKVLAGARP